jgi:MSHA pilin protein MshC
MMGARCSSRERGFTIIELIACIMIMGVVAAMAAPTLVSIQAFTERGYADEVAGALRHAQRVAIASTCPVLVNINGAGYSAWQRPAFANCNAGAWALQVSRPDGTALAGTAPGGTNVAPLAIQYQDDGSLAGGNVMVVIGAHTVSVAAATGRVVVQ